MHFDKGRLRLRRYEMQMAYHAAYLYWNLRGVLAEKWGHGPVFGAYGESQDQVTLTPARTDPLVPVQLAGVYGLRNSALLWEDTRKKEAQDLALEWLSDCLAVLTPRRVVRVALKIVYSYPVKDPKRVTEVLVKDYPNLGSFPPQSYPVKHVGVTFQARETKGDVDVLATGIFGPYGPDQAKSMFQSSTERDSEWALGLIYDISIGSEKGLSEPKRYLEEMAKRGDSESYDLLTRTIMRTISDA